MIYVLSRNGLQGWSISEAASRAEALDIVNHLPPGQEIKVIEGVQLGIEAVSKVTEYQFIKGTR